MEVSGSGRGLVSICTDAIATVVPTTRRIISLALIIKRLENEVTSSICNIGFVTITLYQSYA